MTTVFQQAVQLIAVALAFAFLEQFADIGGGRGGQDLVWMLLMAIAFMYLAGRIPAMLGNHGTFDAWLHTLYFGMSLPAQMVRSGRALGLIAGGAAGGPAGAAAAAAADRRGQQRRRSGELGGLRTPPRPAQNSPTPRSQGPNSRNHDLKDNHRRGPVSRRQPSQEVEPCAAPEMTNRHPQLRPTANHSRNNCGCQEINWQGEKPMDDLTQTISNLVAILLGLVGVVGVGYFIYGAYMYLTASGAPNQMERGKSAMMTALAGIVLALVAYGVVELVVNALAWLTRR